MDGATRLAVAPMCRFEARMRYRAAVRDEKAGRRVSTGRAGRRAQRSRAWQKRLQQSASALATGTSFCGRESFARWFSTRFAPRTSRFSDETDSGVGG